jgi:hypothetical protein
MASKPAVFSVFIISRIELSIAIISILSTKNKIKIGIFFFYIIKETAYIDYE